MDNLRAAWAWAVAREMFDAIAPALRSFGCLFEYSGWLKEGAALLEPVVQAGRRITDTLAGRALLGEALSVQATLFFRLGQFVRARPRVAESVAWLGPLNNSSLLARPLLLYGIILHLDGELDESQTQLEEALVCARAAGDRWAEAYAGYNLGYIASLRGDHRGGYDTMCAGLALWRDLGDPRSIALGLNHLSPTTILLGKYQEAEAFLQESLALCQEGGDRWGMGTALRNLGQAELAHVRRLTPAHSRA